MPLNRFRSLLLACFFAIGGAHAEDDLGVRLDDALQGSQTPAVAALVIREGKVADQAVRGVRRNDEKASAAIGDVWLLGSTSKLISVAAIARLVERGELSWTQPLAESLPDLAESMRPEYRQVTLLELLSHRSRLPENVRDLARINPYFDDPRPLIEQRLEYIGLALQDAPESGADGDFVYSNTGFLIAAVIAERSVGKPIEAIIRQEVFEPLGMKTAGFGSPGAGQPQGHRQGGPAPRARTHEQGVPPMFSAAGFMHMSLQDWAAFCLDQLAGARDAGKLLAPASYRLMQTAQPDSPAGLDWGVQASIAGRQGPALVHGGSDGNWLAYVVLFPHSGNGVLVVANAAEDMGGDQVIHAVLGGLFPSLAPAVETQ